MKIHTLILATLLNAPAAFALAYKFDSSKGEVVFNAKGKPNFMSIKGEGKGVGGALTENDGKISGEVNFDLSTLKTGMDLRDKHMRDEYLETNKYPTALLTFNEFEKPKDPSASFPFKGTLKIKGEVKPVEGTATLDQVGDIATVQAEFNVKLTDYPSIGVPNWKGVTVAEDVKVSVKAEAKKE